METLSTILTWIKDIVGILQSSCSCIAIIIGGFWGYWLFVKNRQKYPRANLSYVLFYKQISEKKMLFRVSLTVSNVGDVLLSLSSLETRIQIVEPLPIALAKKIEDGKNLIKDGFSEIEWPLLDSRTLKFKKGDYEIEPGECQEIQNDFVIDTTINTVAIYSYLQNETKRGREIGWDLTEIHNFAKGELKT